MKIRSHFSSTCASEAAFRPHARAALGPAMTIVAAEV